MRTLTVEQFNNLVNDGELEVLYTVTERDNRPVYEVVDHRDSSRYNVQVEG